MEVRLAVQVREPDPHHPVTALVAIENTHNKCGGAVLPAAWLDQLGALCTRLGLPLHCDGARLFNASAQSGRSLADLLQHCHSASV